MEVDEISENIRNGIYSLEQPVNKNGKRLRSAAWDTWNWILDDDGIKIDGKISCIYCYTVLDYNSTTGTTNLLRHKDECLNTQKRKSLSSLSQNEIKTIKASVNEKVVQFVAQDIRSFRTTSCPGFLALANKLISIGQKYGAVKAEDILPHRTTISKLVTKDAEKNRINVRTKIVQLQKQGLSITLDLWTDDHTKCHYIGINVHYITEGVLNEATLCVKELDELSANADNIHIEIINMLDAYDLDINSVIFVSDRGGEIVAALRGYADRLNCAAHLLKNIIDEMLKKIGDQNPVRRLLDNCRELVTYIKRSHIQHRLPHSLKNEVQSRWNATLSMLKSIKKAQETDDLMEHLELKNKTELLTEIDDDLLVELMEFLDPFLEATLQFENKTKPTIHYVALHRIELEEHLTATEDDSPAIVEMKQIGLAYLRENWIMDDIHMKAVFFHPKLKKLNMFDCADRLLDEIRREAEQITVTDVEETDNEAEYLPRPKKRKLSMEDRIIDDFCNSNFTDRPLDEVQQYLSSFIVVPEGGKIDLCQYWYENRELFPTLYKLSLKYLCVPASSATAESKFSLAGFLINEKRTLIDPDVVNDLLKSIFDKNDPDLLQ